MAYHIHHSLGIVCAARNVGEHDREYYIFTKENGLIRARAKSVRSIGSKLRYALQPFSVVLLDYLRGRSGWKITNAISDTHFSNIIHEKGKRVVCAHAFRLVTRLIHGEERHDMLYQDLSDMMHELERTKDPERMSTIELVIAMRILYRLGYWGDQASDIRELLLAPFATIPYTQLAQVRRNIIPAINDAIRQTQL